MAFKEGDFLEVEYTVWDAASDGILATTDQKKAKDSNIFDEKLQYGPVLIILGSRGVLKGLDRELRSLNPGDLKKLTFKPEDAFGERSEDLVRVMPLSEFRSREIDPYPGMQVNLDDMTAIVKSVNSGRVVVDANHPFAGKNIVYEVKIVKHLTEEKDKVEALSKSYGVKPSQISATGEKVDVFYNNSVSKNADYFIGRASFIASVFANFKSIKTIDIKEEYERPKEQKEEKSN